jgi:CheY-like chemotaxis protein
VRALQVLLIDDDAPIRRLVGLVLGAAGCAVVPACHGAAALALLDQAEQAHVHPHVILLDMDTPVMDGRAFARAYRCLPGRAAPIVMFTARQGASRCADEIGAAGVIAKPFDVERLPSLVRRYAGRRAA